jgi:hypothetical protein
MTSGWTHADAYFALKQLAADVATLRARADNLWNAFPVAGFEPVLALRNDLERHSADIADALTQMRSLEER